MKTYLSIAVFLTTLFICSAQGPIAIEQPDEHKKVSLYLGYGTQKVAIRLDCKLSEDAFGYSNSFHQLYLDFGVDFRAFEETKFRFSGVDYPSDVRIVYVGLGYGWEIIVDEKLYLQPNIGFRYASVRFTDQDLVDAIGEKGIVRYWNNEQVGPEVDNAYGNSTALDIGGRLGFRVTSNFQVNVGLGYSALGFSTSSTLFGKYWGEAPHSNPYYIRLNPIRFDAGLRLFF